MQAHLNALPGGLSKLSAVAGFLSSTFWGFRRYREHETPIEIEERIALEVALALDQERERIRSALEVLHSEAMAKAELAYKEGAEKVEKLWRGEENRTQLVKLRIHTQQRRSSAFWPPYRYKTTRHKGRTRQITAF
jgi:hypothetical protein